jgi:hypothetical protein
VRILQLIRDIVNEGAELRFSEDWGGNSLTIDVEMTSPHFSVPKLEPFSYHVQDGDLGSKIVPCSGTHTHVGVHDFPFLTLEGQTEKVLEYFLEQIRKEKAKSPNNNKAPSG